jgi:hypothetical protein
MPAQAVGLSPLCTCSKRPLARSAWPARARPGRAAAACRRSMPISSVRAGSAAVDLLDQQALARVGAGRQEGAEVGGEGRAHDLPRRQPPAAASHTTSTAARRAVRAAGVAASSGRRHGFDQHQRAVAAGQLQAMLRTSAAWPTSSICRTWRARRASSGSSAAASPLGVAPLSSVRSACCSNAPGRRSAWRAWRRAARQFGHRVQRHLPRAAAALEQQRAALHLHRLLRRLQRVHARASGRARRS